MTSGCIQPTLLPRTDANNHFNSRGPNWGWSQFVLLSEMRDPESGFRTDDKVMISASVVAELGDEASSDGALRFPARCCRSFSLHSTPIVEALQPRSFGKFRLRKSCPDDDELVYESIDAADVYLRPRAQGTGWIVTNLLVGDSGWVYADPSAEQLCPTELSSWYVLNAASQWERQPVTAVCTTVHSGLWRHCGTVQAVDSGLQASVTGQYTWTIENFNQFQEPKLYSPIFQSGPYNWCVLLGLGVTGGAGKG